MKTLAKGEVFERYGVELTRFATSMVGPSDAQDVVSDALVSTMWSDGWDDVENQRAYLYRAVASRARMHHRSSGRRRIREMRVARPLVSTDKGSEVEVWEALSHLSVTERAVIFLIYWEDLTEIQCSRRLGVSERTVRRRLASARQELGRQLA